MDYKKAYKEAVERASKIKLRNPIGRIQDEINSIFPELKESEDERIRKAQLNYWRSVGGKEWYGVPVQEAIAWLEKQGEQKPIDMIEPKFKVGDWIIRRDEGCELNTYFVTEVKDYYVCEGLNGRRVTFTFNDVHKNFKLFDISDAKDGDVIKEQRDLLFRELKEEGYEWDAEKNVLRKIEKNPTWSEEDEDAVDIAIRIIQNGGDDCAGILYSDKALKWLKSLKDRVQPQPQHRWKPSEEQMQALFEAKLASTRNREYFLESLYNELKKL